MKLQTCPFCNMLPAINSRQSGAGYWLVECKNADCCVKVEAIARKREDAIEKWNIRPSAT